MKVAVATLYPTEPRRIAGGVRTVAHHLVQGLGRWPDLDVHVVHCHSEVNQNREVANGNVTVHYRAMPKRRLVPNTVVAVSRVGRILKRLSPAVVNAHTGHYAVSALRARLPTVYTVHGIAFREAQVYAHKGLRERLRFYMEMYYDALAMRQVKHAIAISPYAMREYGSRTRAQWYRIDNPLPDEFFELDNRGRAGQVLFTGTITEVKDILTLLKAFAMVRDELPDVPCHLRIAGRTTSPAYEQMLKEYVRENALGTGVTFVGMLERSALLDEYAECEVLALPSRQENAPMAIIEAMAASKPVVATRVGGIPGLVRDGETGFLVEPGDASGMASALTRLLTDEGLRTTMGARARQEASSRFRQESVARKYREVYYSVAGLTPPVSRGCA
jgi:glycosyltransferase involved in cell wall biosynthesis